MKIRGTERNNRVIICSLAQSVADNKGVDGQKAEGLRAVALAMMVRSWTSTIRRNSVVYPRWYRRRATTQSRVMIHDGYGSEQVYSAQISEDAITELNVREAIHHYYQSVWCSQHNDYFILFIKRLSTRCDAMRRRRRHRHRRPNKTISLHKLLKKYTQPRRTPQHSYRATREEIKNLLSAESFTCF